MSEQLLEAGLHWSTTFFNQQNNKPVFTITKDGRFVPGEGLSDDEVTQRLAKFMSGAFQFHIRNSVSKDMADEIERLREALHPLYHAASGISFGEDWNNGTHAKLHGYRQKLIDALPAARAALGEGKE